MKRIIIVVEGQTEQDFVEQSIQPYLFTKHGIHSVSARLIGKPGYKGGDVRYARLKSDLNILLREKDVIVSTWVDYFKLGTDFPEYDNSQKLINTDHRIDCLEKALVSSINSNCFVPYIQKHEFEALLFSSIEGYENYLKSQTCERLEAIRNEFANPEDINNNQPPSYRLKEIFREYEHSKYDKVTLGNILALETGMEKILERCPRFANWIEKLAHMATQA